MTRDIILAIICVAFGGIIGYVLAAGSKDAMDAFDQALIDMETGNQGENEMDDMEQGHVPAEDMGVAYTYLGIDPLTGNVGYKCDACVKEEVTLPELWGQSTHIRETMLSHAGWHGFSAFTVDDETTKEPADVPSILFKRVTVVRDEQGYHRYECSADMHIVSQGDGINYHMERYHKGMMHYYDHKPAGDSWKPGQGIMYKGLESLPTEGKIVPWVDYSSGERKVVGEGRVFPDGRVDAKLTDAAFPRLAGDLSIGFPGDKINFEFPPAPIEGLKFSPASIKAQLDRLIAPVTKPSVSFAEIEGFIASSVNETWDRVGEQIPDGFDGTIESEDGPFGRTAMLAGLDKKTVPFKNGHTIAFVDNDGKLTWGD